MSIYDIQYTEDPSGDSPYVGQTVQTGGIVTGIDFNNQPIRYFIADRQGGLWRGILVNDNVQRNLSIGDSVSFEARVQESSSQTRLYSITSSSFVTLPVGSSVPTTPITSGAISENAEGVLVELGECYVVNLDDGIRVDDGSGPVLIGDGWTFAYEPLLGDTLQYVRGLVSYDGSEFVVNPRDDDDFGFFANRAPLISQVTHSPDRPSAIDPVTVTARITDDSGLDDVKAYYRFGTTGDFASIEMFDDGLHNDEAADDNIWGTRLPAGPERTQAQYYISAIDIDGAETRSPAAAPAEFYGYFIRTVELSIFDLQYSDPPSYASPYNGQTVTVIGIVTCEDFRGGDIFISDPGGGIWGGIYYFSPPAEAARGDCVRVTAEVSEYNGLTELSYGSMEILGQGTLPDPVHITYEELFTNGEPYEGVLVTADTCVVTDVSGNYLSYGQFSVRAGSQSGVLRVDDDLEYIPVQGDSFRTFTGVGDYNSNPGFMIAARDDADIGYIDRRPPTVLSSKAVTPNHVNIRFNERLRQEDLTDLPNFSGINLSLPDFPAIEIVSAQLFSDQRTIQVELFESMVSTQAYQITIQEVSDTTGNILENVQVNFQGYDPIPTVAIADIYANFDSLDGLVATLRGVVNFMQDVTTTSGSRRISAFIQDESYQLYGENRDTLRFGYSLSQTGPAADFPNIRRGNLIEITGEINVYDGAIQLGSFLGNSDDIRLLSENVALPEPIEVRTGDRRLQSLIIHTSSPGAWGSGTWCRVAGTVYQVDENVGGGTNIFIDDGSGNVTIRVWDSMELDSVFIGNEWLKLGELVGKQMTISGPSSFYDGDFQMLAGYAEDFTDIPTGMVD
ncbi:hypothetical protein EH220_06180, partial [bacterium]